MSESWDNRACKIVKEIDKWKSLKIDVDRILNELKPHSPLWVYRLRKYIRYLERCLDAALALKEKEQEK